MSTPLNLTLSDASGLPYYRQVLDQMASMIRSGSLPPGAALPSVRALAVDLKVSVITTRRAYAELQSAGLVVRRQGKGTFVAEQAQAAGWAEHQARDVLSDAVKKCRELGLNDGEVRDLVLDLLEER